MALTSMPINDPVTAKAMMQNVLNSMPWDGSGPIDPLVTTTDYFIKTYGAGTGLSAEEIAATVADAYHYNGVPEAGYTPKSGEDDPTRLTGPSQADISAYNARVNENYQLAVAKAQRDREAELLGFSDTLEDLEKSEKALGVSKDSGLQGNAAYFSAVSPDAYQSQMGNYNQKVLDAYTEGLGTINRNKERVGQAKTRYEQDYADYLRGLELNRQGDLQSYGTGGNYSSFAASDAAKVGALGQVNTAAPISQAANAHYAIANIIDPEGMFTGRTQPKNPTDPYDFLRI